MGKFLQNKHRVIALDWFGIVDGKFRQISTELLPLIYVEIRFPLSILSIFNTYFLQTLYKS